MSQNSHIVGTDQLRTLSGKKSRSAICKWASTVGIRVLDGKDGPWTTIEAVNKGLGVSSANEESYQPEEVL